MSLRVAILLIFASFVSLHAQTVPEGKGKEILEGPCSECHGSDEVLGRYWTPERWLALVRQMVNKGADLTDEQTKTLLDYLNKNFGPVNVNKATSKDMQTKLMLSSGEADAIVRYREMHGAFKNWDEFSKVPGINAAKLDGIKDSVAFQ
jgi:competence ComEA-like helix-hairpin-helix protein